MAEAVVTYGRSNGNIVGSLMHKLKNSRTVSTGTTCDRDSD